jgi:hypothetical protein
LSRRNILKRSRIEAELTDVSLNPAAPQREEASILEFYSQPD